MKKKKSKLVLISLILTILYVIYLISYTTGVFSNANNDAQVVGTGLAVAIVMPHFVSTVIGLIFNLLGYFLNHRAFVLTSAILYSVAIVLFPIYFMFVIVQMILMYIAFAKMKKEKKSE